MASNSSDGKESTEPTQPGEGVSQEKQHLEVVHRELVAVSNRINLCDAVLKDLKDLRDLTDVLLKKSLQEESMPPHK